MAFHQSSQLRDGGYKTSHNVDEIRSEFDYVLFAMGYEGVLILSKKRLLSFFNNMVNGNYSGNRYKINIYKEWNCYIWRGRNGYRLDVSDCFVKKC